MSYIAAATIALFAAGSLRPALTEAIRVFTAATAIGVTVTYGSSGLLRERIESGEHADLFTSADISSPQRLRDAGKSGAVTIFARNRMCLLIKKQLALPGRSVDDLLLDPSIRLVTSTPNADPSGDYAWEIFRKVDAARPGSFASLDAKALRLFGGADAVQIPAGTDAGVYLLGAADRGDAMLLYCTGTLGAVAAAPQLTSLEMPPALAVRADYGLTLPNGAAPEAERLRGFLLSPEGQAILVKFGFSPA